MPNHIKRELNEVMKFSNADICRAIANNTSLTQPEVKIVLNEFVSLIRNTMLSPIYSIDREPSIEGRRALYHGPLLQGELQEPPMGLGEVPDAPEDRPMGVASGVPIGRMLIGRDDVSGR